MNFRRAVLAFITVVLTLPISVAVLAQEVAAPEPVRTEHGDWIAQCVETPAKRCQMLQGLFIENEQGNNRLLETTVVRADDGTLVMQWLLPLGVDLRPGVAVKIDEHPEFNAAYLTCMASGCLVAAQLDDVRFAQLQGGKIAKLGFRSINNPQNLVIDISLKGFTNASREAGLP